MTINSFTGGMGNDDFLLAEGQYVYSENLDIYRDPRYIQLAVKPTNYKTGLASMVYIIGSSVGYTTAAGQERGIYFALENKDIIDANNQLRFDGSTIRPDNSSSPYYSNWRAFANVSTGLVFWDYFCGVYIPSQVSAPAASPTWNRDSGTDYDWTNYAFSFLQSGAANLGSTGQTRPAYLYSGDTYFADEGDQYLIRQTSTAGGMPSGGVPFGPGYPTVTVYPQSISQPGDVTFSSVHSDSIWSGSGGPTRLSTELCAFSSGITTAGTKQLQVDKYSRVLHGVNKNNTDILVAGDVKEFTYGTNAVVPSAAEYSQVYVYKHYGFGSDAQQLIAKSRYYNAIETAFDNHGIAFYLVGIYGLTDYNWARINDMVYCISNKDDVGLIYAYGKSVAGLNDAWSVIVSKNSSGKKMKRIGCLWRNYAKNGFLYSYEDEDGVFGVDYFDDITIDTPTSFQPSGKIFLRRDDGGDMSVSKEVKMLQLGCKVPTDTTIKISYILDDDGTEVDYQTITHTTQGAEDYKTYRGNVPVRGFKSISWFAELATTGTSTPQLLNFNYELGIVQA